MTTGTGAALDAAATWAALAGGVAAAEVARDVVAVRGRDARSWMQGQVSQDLRPLAVGGSSETLVLAPEGRLVAVARVTLLSEEELLLDTDGGAGEALVERLRRFRLRVKADVEPLAWRAVALRGPAAGEAAAAAAGEGGEPPLAVPWRWTGDEGWDLLGPGAAIPPGVPRGDGQAMEAARIAAGVPRHGAELGERTLPHEAGIIERAVSFEKGCYTGQELVARLDARGARVPRRLRGIVLDRPGDGAAPLVVAGDEIRVGGRPVGTVTSSARSPATGRTVALAYVRREVEPPAACETDAGPGLVASLPMADLGPRGAAGEG